MNERIKELAVQAEFKVYEGDRVGTPGYGDYIKDGALEKFAELIVQECAQIAKDTQDFYNEHNDGIINTEIWTMIKYRFGVDN